MRSRELCSDDLIQCRNIGVNHLCSLVASLVPLATFVKAMVEQEGADEGSFFPMVVPLTIGRWSLH